MTDNLLMILVALCITSFIHNVIEVWGMQQKVKWLGQSMQGLEHGRWPIDIDSKAKTIVVHATIFFAVTGVGFLFLKFLGISEKGLLTLGASVLTISYLYTTWIVDKYHTEIGALINRTEETHQ